MIWEDSIDRKIFNSYNRKELIYMIRFIMKRRFDSYSDFVLWKRKNLDGAYITIKKLLKKDDMNDCRIEMILVGWIRFDDRVA